MTLISDRQHIARRRKKKSFRTINNSAGFNAGFMSRFNQKPVRNLGKKSEISGFFPFISFRDTKKKKHKPIPKHKEPSGNLFKKSAEEKKTNGFNIPIPSFTTLAVVTGTVVLALAAFNWDNKYYKVPEKYIFEPAADTEVGRYIQLYAATGITGILPDNKTGIFSDTAAAAETVLDELSIQNDLLTFEWRQYKVQKGDSISVIAKLFDVSIGAVIASNEIRNARTLQEGAVLRIPNIDGIPYQIKKGDSLSKIAVSFKVPLEVILDVNDIKSDDITPGETLFIPGARMNDIDLRLSLGELFIYPVPSRFITSHYGMRKDPISGALTFHTGIDLRANTGTAVVAALDGVISVVSENWLYGKHIIITHSNGYKTLYGHLNSYSVKQGDKVTRGKKIGEAGNTGYSTGPHLHFSIFNRNNKLVNPVELMR
jgi:murein DD-endopeptidase MepM/ murein hydrolase activator NlpD